MTFLIDGYNLMHAVGLLAKGRPPGGLERARTRFLDWLATEAEGREVVLRVVFDAEKGTGRTREADHRGVRVRFAFRRTADDEIEELLAAESRPERVTVVSNDGRVQDAGRRRRAVVFTCQEFVDWLIEAPPPVADAPDSPKEKPEPSASPDEMAAWLAEFSKPRPRRKS